MTIHGRHVREAVESERLRYLRYNQQKLRVEEYIHLRDAIVSHADTTEIGNSIIQPSTYIGNPRRMQEYNIYDFRARIRLTVFIYHVYM